MHCPNCGQKILEGSDFCSNCGAPVVRQLVGPTCVKCGSRNLPEAEFCAECGARLGGETIPMQSFCPECGAAVKESATFCKMCGAKLKEATVPVQSVCPGCGEALPPDAVFCGNCGMSLEQGGAYASGSAPVESDPSYQTQEQEYVQQQAQYQQQAQTQDWEYPQQQQAQPQDQEYPRQEEQYPPQFQNREPVYSQPQAQPPQKSNRNKMLMAAAAAVVLLVVGITGFWKPGFLLDLFRPTVKLENGTLALNDITLDFKQTNLANGKATMTTVKDKEVEVQNGLIGDLYVMKVDKTCQGKVTVAVPAPKDFKQLNDKGVYMKLGIGRDYPLADGKTTRYYEYYDATIKDGKAVAVIDPATAGLNRHKSKTSAKPAEETPDLGEFTEYVGYFYKQGIISYGEGYQNSKGHFRLWYSYHMLTSKNVYMGADDAQRLLGDMEEAYNYYKTHGFADYVDAFTPIDVYIEDSKDEGGWFSLSGNMQIREKSVFGENRNERYEGALRKNVKTTIYHEFFHAVQQGIINMVASAISKTLWFDEATATHFEKVVNPVTITQNGDNNFHLLWGGLIPEQNTQDEGYARGLMIDYISSKKGGDAWIRECYEHWGLDCWKLKSYMRDISGSEAGFAADFYMEVIKKLGNRSLGWYYSSSQLADKLKPTYLSALRLEMNDKTKEKIKNGAEDALPVVFTSPSFALGGYGGHVVSLASSKRVGNTMENLTEIFPDKCQLKIEAEGGCRIQIIRFTTEDNAKYNIVKGNIIKNFREQTDKGYKFLVLVTSTQRKKQNAVLKATLEMEQLKEGIYNGKATMTQGKKTGTRNNVLGFRLSQGKDGKWGLNVCQANGDYASAAANVPLTYDAKQKIWKGHRKFKENVSKDPNFPKIETGPLDYTMKVNLEGKEPVLIIKFKSEGTSWKWGFPTKEKYEIKFEGKWVSELKGRNLKAGKEGKVIILE